MEKSSGQKDNWILMELIRGSDRKEQVGRLENPKENFATGERVFLQESQRLVDSR